MTVLRIVANLRAEDPQQLAQFYRALFGLDVLMDMGWIVTLGNTVQMQPQLSLAREGGSGTPVPDLSIAVDDVDAVWDRAAALDLAIAYPLTDEPWGVRRFYLHDPAGRLLNIVQHRS